MSRKRGRMVYVPPNIIEEAEKIQLAKDLPTRALAFDELVKYSQVGREAEKILSFDWELFKKKRKK